MLKLFRLGDLVECRVVSRVNRFVVAVNVRGEHDLAHLTNTGRLLDYLVPGRRGLCAPIGGPRLRYRLVAVEDAGGYAIVDTITQSRVFEHLLSRGLLTWLSPGCGVYRRNFRLGGEVIDYILRCPEGLRLAELKSAVLRIGGSYASYPDCPTARGRRQIRTLADLAQGYRPLVVFIASLPNVSSFRPNRAGDPEIPEVLEYALERGVELRAVSFYLAGDGWVVLASTDLPVELDH